MTLPVHTLPDHAPAAPALCVVICCYTSDRWALTTAAADAVVAQLASHDRLIIVVDHNDGLERRLVERLGGDASDRAVTAQLLITPSTAATGLSGARNSGLDLAVEDVVVYLDDDAVVRPGALAEVRRAFTDPTVVAIGGRVEPAWAERPPSWFPDEFGWVVGCDYRGIAADGTEIRNPIGAAMAIRRQELVQIGGFNPDLGRVGALPAGCEETLMGIDLRRRFPDGRVIRRVGFCVDHHVPAHRADLGYFLSRCLHEGRSKAIVTAKAGANQALSTEIRYVTRTLTTGIARYTAQLARGDTAAATRVGLLLAGLFVTAFGTVTGSVRRRGPSPSATVTHPQVTASDKVSVVIPTVGRDILPATVRAALAQDHPNLEVIVVDNRPAHSTVRDLLAGFHDIRLRVVDQPVSGVSAARNAGAAVASGRIIAFTDDDAAPDPSWARHLVTTFAADTTGTLGVVSGRVFAVDGSSEIQEWFEATGMFDKGPRATVWPAHPRPDLDVLGEPGERTVFFPYVAGQFGSGNNMAFAVEALNSIGGFDERLGTGTPTRGGEDLDAFRTAILAGWTACYRPEAIVRHHHRDTITELRSQCYGYGTGMAASLAKVLVSRHAIGAIRCLPTGLWLLFSPRSSRNDIFPAEWPRHLRLIEQLGYLTGPWLFARSHLRQRRQTRAPSVGQPR